MVVHITIDITIDIAVASSSGGVQSSAQPINAGKLAQESFGESDVDTGSGTQTCC